MPQAETSMPPAHSHPHSPSPNPYTQPTAAAPPPQVRRNLFSTHLSRRPASSQQPSQETQTYIPPLSPTRSPSRSPGHSPTNTRSHPSSTAIIETHPNGRPLLPTLPHLAARLRLSTTSDDEDEHLNNPEDEASRNNSPTRYNHAHPTASLPNADTDASDRERIERSLVEMMSRQRQRVGGGSSSSPRALRSGAVAAGVEPEGRTREEEELLNLILGSLREKVVVLEGEGWMFGERVEDTQGMV